MTTLAEKLKQNQMIKTADKTAAQKRAEAREARTLEMNKKRAANFFHDYIDSVEDAVDSGKDRLPEKELPRFMDGFAATDRPDHPDHPLNRVFKYWVGAFREEGLALTLEMRHDGVGVKSWYAAVARPLGETNS